MTNVLKVETGSRGEIEFVGEVEIDVILGDWCRKYFDDEVVNTLDEEFDSEEDKENYESYVEEYFNLIEVEKDSLYTMGLGEERVEYYVDLNNKLLVDKVEYWKGLGWRGDWDDLSDDMIWSLIEEMDVLSW